MRRGRCRRADRGLPPYAVGGWAAGGGDAQRQQDQGAGKPYRGRSASNHRVDGVKHRAYSPRSVRLRGGPGGPVTIGGGGDGRGPEAETPPNLFTAVQEQLGLKLEPRKTQAELIVIDHLEKAPIEN